jgi:hypothetical protein
MSNLLIWTVCLLLKAIMATLMPKGRLVSHLCACCSKKHLFGTFKPGGQINQLPIGYGS